MSGGVVYRYEVPVDDQPHRLPTGLVLHVGCRNDPAVVEVWLWVQRSPIFEGHEIAVQVFGTGHPLPPEVQEHLGTTLAADGYLVWHLFRVQP